MAITSSELSAMVDREVARLSDQRVITHIRSLLVQPHIVMRYWDYGTEPQSFPCWTVLEHNEFNTGIGYCEFGFGPRSPWGLVSISGNLSLGMDSGWFSSFLDAYFDSMAITELPIWRVFKKEGGTYPGSPLTLESDWDTTWKEVYRLRELDSSGRYNCSHSIVVQTNET